MKKLPKYIEKALADRLKYQQKANTANEIITEYAIKNNLITTTTSTSILHLGSFISDIVIYCEPEVAYSNSREMLVRHINNLPLTDE